ncbi:transcription factor, partial [Nannochloropsis gaditana]
MFRHTFQSGFLSILYSLGNKPLQLWDKSLHNGSIKRVGDEDVSSGVLELVGENVAENFIACPADSKDQLGIKLPWLVLVVKNVRLKEWRVRKLEHVGEVWVLSGGTLYLRTSLWQHPNPL